MRASFNLLCAATLMFALASCAELNNEATGTGNYYGDAGRSLEPLNVAADPETINYLLPRLTAKYRPNNDWTGVTDPRFYLLTEMESNDIDNQVRKRRRRSNSLIPKYLSGTYKLKAKHCKIHSIMQTELYYIYIKDDCFC